MRLFLCNIFFCLFSLIADGQKVFNIIGDSYVANHRSPYTEAWHYKLAQEKGFVYNNYGKNGSCIAFDRTHDGKWNFGPAMWQRYKAMEPNADYVIIIAGHNDADMVARASNNPKMYKDSLKMFKDSLVTMIKGIKTLCPKARIGFVTPWYVDRPGFADVCNIIKKVCKKEGIPVLWNYDEGCVIKVRDEAFRKKYFQGGKGTDTAHLNEAGHNLFLPVGKKWFEEFVVSE